LKKRLPILTVAVLAAALCPGCQKPVPEPVHLEGHTMGTTYQVIYFDKGNRNFQAPVDSLLKLINRSISTYDSTSEVSRLNRGRGIATHSPFLLAPLKKGMEISRLSNGAFDLTVMPLVNAWGFGPGKMLNMDSTRVDSLKAFVGFNNIRITRDSIVKANPRTQLDFGGIGQGYGADVIAGYLRAKGITDLLIELGGEGIAHGKNLKTGKPWTIGILDPNSTRDDQFFKAYVSLTNQAYTTAGSYFNYREVNGQKYSHTIDPATGYPANRAILSASVFAADGTTADAWDTAFMVMGHEKAMAYLKDHPELDAILMYTNPAGEVELFITEGIKSKVTLEAE
jgi:FAD:protein FMN transferase